MDIALVQHAEDDVDGDERGEDQNRFIRKRCLEGAAVPRIGID